MKWFKVVGNKVISSGVPVFQQQGASQEESAFSFVMGTDRGKEGFFRVPVRDASTLTLVPADEKQERMLHRVCSADLDEIATDQYEIVAERDSGDCRAVVYWTIEAGFDVEQRISANPRELGATETEAHFNEVFTGKGAKIIARRTYPYTHGRPGEICEVLAILNSNSRLFAKRESAEKSFGRYRDAVARLVWDGAHISVTFGDTGLYAHSPGVRTPRQQTNQPVSL